MLTPNQIQEVQQIVSCDQKERLQKLFQILGEPNRFRLFRLLALFNDLCVTDLAQILELSLPSVSHHCRVLELAGLVKRIRMGKLICYEVQADDPAVGVIIQLIQ